MAGTPQGRVIATYLDRSSAQAAADRLRAAGIDSSVISIDSPSDDTAASIVEQHEEGEKLVGGPGVVMTTEMAKGSVFGGTAAAFALAGVGLVAALVLRAMDLIGWFVVGLIVLGFFAAGLTLGTVLGGSVKAQERAEEEPPRVEHRLSVRSSDSGEAQRAAGILRETRPTRLDVI